MSFSCGAKLPITVPIWVSPGTTAGELVSGAVRDVNWNRSKYYSAFHHIVGTFDGSSLRLYKDGSLRRWTLLRRRLLLRPALALRLGPVPLVF